MTATRLLETAEDLMTRTTPESLGRWPRASAMLVRQALDESIDELAPYLAPVTQSSARLMGLRDLLQQARGDEGAAMAGEVAVAYGDLSRMLHHHAYELPPTVEELRQTISVVRKLREMGGGARGLRSSA